MTSYIIVFFHADIELNSFCLVVKPNFIKQVLKQLKAHISIGQEHSFHPRRKKFSKNLKFEIL